MPFPDGQRRLSPRLFRRAVALCWPLQIPFDAAGGVVDCVKTCLGVCQIKHIRIFRVWTQHNPCLEKAVNEVALEGVKAVFSLGVAVVTLGFGWLIGQRLSNYWSYRQKQKEIDLSAAQDFHRLYGEFFAVWKLWNYFIRDVGATNLPGATRWELLKRACDAESFVERVFVKLAAERALSPLDRDRLGSFRQGYQSLREAIRDNQPLRWDSSTHPEYLAFKSLAVEVAMLIQVGTVVHANVLANHVQALLDITSNRFEGTWVKAGRRTG